MPAHVVKRAQLFAPVANDQHRLIHHLDGEVLTGVGH